MQSGSESDAQNSTFTVRTFEIILIIYMPEIPSTIKNYLNKIYFRKKKDLLKLLKKKQNELFSETNVLNLFTRLSIQTINSLYSRFAPTFLKSAQTIKQTGFFFFFRKWVGSWKLPPWYVLTYGSLPINHLNLNYASKKDCTLKSLNHVSISRTSQKAMLIPIMPLKKRRNMFDNYF